MSALVDPTYYETTHDDLDQALAERQEEINRAFERAKAGQASDDDWNLLAFAAGIETAPSESTFVFMPQIFFVEEQPPF